MISELFKDLFYLFYPITCCNCNSNLSRNEFVLCVPCRHDLPYSHYTKHKNNPIETLFFGRIPVQAATSLFLFSQKGMGQKLIHQLKYQGKENIGKFAGFLLAEELIKSKRFQNLDCIIPVPLHRKKQQQRGYNQLTTFGKSLSETLKIPFKENLLIKTSSSTTQTKKNKFDRWKNTIESFELRDTTFLENKHILLIDDVVTTGATIEACAHTLQQPKNATLSIATIAHTINF